ncbi:YihY/virulence factor BrkB family protein [Ascidiaceihabitans sp.]|uniref:YihY/virulence factor BrkB family protein n=1 Tax=Ascidiaceihabitans sp. TaxID=1872644 RepID=UPI003297B488
MHRLKASWTALNRVFRIMDERNLGLIAAGVAFYGILAVFPGLATVIALWGVIGDPGAVALEMAEFQAMLPADVYALLDQQLNALAQADGLTLGWASGVSLALAIWSARAGVAALMRGLNAIYNVPNRDGLAHYTRALTLTVALVVVAVIAIACVVFAPIALQFVPLGPLTAWGIEAARWIIALGVLLAGFSLIYRFGPNRLHKINRWVTPGAVVSTFCWAAASAGFSYYLSNFGAYNEVYGSIGAVIAMLMWLYISAWLVLLGGGLNAELEYRSRLAQNRQPQPDA